MYRGRTQRDELLGPYLSEGLRAGDTCFVAISDQDSGRVRAFSADEGPGELIVRTEPVFAENPFDTEDVITFWEQLVTAALDTEGVDFVRLSAEGTWWMKQAPTLDDLHRYEVRLNDFVARHRASILCLYDIDELGAGIVFDAMKAHPRIWLSGLVLENPFFETPG
jgi:hypothetical protein